MLEVRGGRERNEFAIRKLPRQQIAEARAELFAQDAPGRAARGRRKKFQTLRPRTAEPRDFQRQAIESALLDAKHATHHVALSRPKMQKEHIALLAELVAEVLDRRQPRAILVHLDVAGG